MATFPIGYNGAVGDESKLSTMDGWLKVDPAFRSRLLSLFAASGGKVGFGEGWRSAETQAAGAAAKPGIVAPQGKSWHEVGMAVDLVGDMDWLQENAARFGLKTFADVNNEPWHVQPIEVPNARPQGAAAPQLSGSPANPGGNVGTLGNTQAAGTQPVTLPSDAQVYNVQGLGIFAMFEPSPGVFIYYDVPWQDGTVTYDPNQVQGISGDDWNARFPGAVSAGNATELGTTSLSFGTFQGQWDAIINQVMGFNNPARNDPEVLRVIAEFAGRPDMTEAELQNRLQATQWFQKRTSEELEYNSLSDAEKQKRRDEAEARMIATVFQYSGENVDGSDPRVANYVEQVASGKMGFGAFTEVVKGSAESNPESPWSRTQRDEQEAQKQRPIDIENTAQRIREQAERWGLQWSPQTVQKWAKDMVEKNLSDEDLNKTFRDQAAVLYPWKSPELETATAAAPWLETYRRVYEAPGSLFDPQVQKALTAGQSVWEFEQDLKKSDKWLGTQNGQQSVESAAAQMGRVMGFV